MRTDTALAIACLGLLIAGCDSQMPPQPPHSVAHEHDHGHGHSHAQAGPHGGDLVELGDEAYHLEWTHDDEAEEVTIYILDGDAKELVPIASETISILSKIDDETKGEQTSEYKLAAIDPTGDPPTSAQFSLKSGELLTCLSLAGQGSEVSISLTIEGEDYVGRFEHDDHDEHGHNH